MYNTIEEAQERILELEEQLNERTMERDTLSQNNVDLAAQLEKARDQNQRYFEKLQAQIAEPDEDEDEAEPVPTCTEIAHKIKLT